MIRGLGIILLSLAIITVGCVAASQVQEQTHSHTTWEERAGGNTWIAKTTIPEDNVTCYTIMGGSGVGIDCMRGV